jgi:hypothetical protein
MHIGIDIQARSGASVYALQSGTAAVSGRGTSDVRVLVGRYEYWHVIPSVSPGQHVVAFSTVLGHVLGGARHLHLSETLGGAYLNPLRPGGRVLEPYRDDDRPVIGRLRQARTGLGYVEVFDPQSVREFVDYRTPVLAPAAVAWRPRDREGHAIGPLRFAYRGSQHLPDAARSLYGPGSEPPDHPDKMPGGWACFASWNTCVPTWNYDIAGIPAAARAVTVYAWDWRGNTSARTSSLG